ncbi:MAG: hypothetical protein ACYDA6_07550 [Solirubrobacteraceae bacterium]
MRALERANEVRIARAELKRRIARGTLDAAEVLLACPWEAASMAVGDLLTSQQRWGQTRSRKLLAQIPMTERKTIGSMTDRQRRTLADLLTACSRKSAPRSTGQDASSDLQFHASPPLGSHREPTLATA